MTTEGGEEVMLLGKWMGPFKFRVQIALSLKKIGHKLIEEKLENKSDLLLNSNAIHKKIPVLLHKGHSVCESLVILNYIDEAWSIHGTSILPTDPQDRVTARFWATYIDDKWFPNLIGFVGAKTEEEKAAAIDGMLAGLRVLEDAFEICSMKKNANYFNGDSIGYVDIVLGSFLGWILAIEKISGKKILDEGRIPLLVGWAKRFSYHDAVKGEMAKPDMLVEHAKFLHAKWNNESSQGVSARTLLSNPLRSLWM